eukprot:259194_1
MQPQSDDNDKDNKDNKPIKSEDKKDKNTIRRLDKCTKLQYIASDVTQIQWNQCLCRLDAEIMGLYDTAEKHKIVVRSFPYKVQQIAKGVADYMKQNFQEDSLMHCFDIILQYLSSTEESLANEKSKASEWKQLVDTQAVVIIDTVNSELVTIPRDVGLLKDWSIIWINNKTYTHFASINDKLSELIIKHFGEKFEMLKVCRIGDWEIDVRNLPPYLQRKFS